MWPVLRPIVTDVAWFVCLLITTVSATNTDEPFEVPFAAWTRVGPCVRLGPDLPDIWAEGSTSPALYIVCGMRHAG